MMQKPYPIGGAVDKTSFTRREFIEIGAVAAGASIAGEHVALGQALASRPLQSVQPSDGVRFGNMGVGMQGSGLLGDSIQLEGVECVAACDLYDGRHTLAREIVRADLPVTRRYQALLDNKDVDCIIAAVPDSPITTTGIQM